MPYTQPILLLIFYAIFSSAAQSASIALTEENKEVLERIVLGCNITLPGWTLKQQQVHQIIKQCPQAKAVLNRNILFNQQISISQGFDEQNLNYNNQNGVYGKFSALDLNLSKDFSSGLSLTFQGKAVRSNDHSGHQNSSSYLSPGNILLSYETGKINIDLGAKEHWYGVSSQSNFMFSNNAQSLVGITLSNSEALSLFGQAIYYDVFYGNATYTQDIIDPYGSSRGYPALIGTMLAIKPGKDFTLAAYRVLQFSGGHRQASFSKILEAYINPRAKDNSGTGPNNTQNELGNQIAGIASAINIPLDNKMLTLSSAFSGEDTEGGGYRLGNNSLEIGAAFFNPDYHHLLIKSIYSVWHTAWYTHGIYRSGLSDNGFVYGKWFANYIARGRPGYSLELDASISKKWGLLGAGLKMLATSRGQYYEMWEPSMRYFYSSKRYHFSASIAHTFSNQKQNSKILLKAGTQW